MHLLVFGKILPENEAPRVVFEVVHSLGLVPHQSVGGFDCLVLLATPEDWCGLGRAPLRRFKIGIKLKMEGVLILELLPLGLPEILVDVVLHVGLFVDP